MPPKVKIAKGEIIDAALQIVRTQGAGAINARTVAAALSCSTQPVFSNFATMGDLRLAVAQKAEAMYGEYMQREIASGKYPAYKASGMAYIRFAKEERELFKLLYMCDRKVDPIPDSDELQVQMEAMVHSNVGLQGMDARLFHLEMWAYVHGIATMFATGYLDLDWDLVSNMLTDSFQGLKKQHEKEET